MPESPVRLPGNRAASRAVDAAYYGWVRRELWEDRSSYIAPLAIAAFVLFGF